MGKYVQRRKILKDTETSTDMKKEIKPLPSDVAALNSKSARIRALRDRRWKVGDIARTVGVSYQFAHNVCNRPLKRLIKEQREAARAKLQQQKEQGERSETTIDR